MENETQKQNSEYKCPYCSSKNIVKRGVRKTENRGNIQRFSCKDCNKRFVKHDAFFRMRNNPQKITMTMDLYYKGVSFRKISEHLQYFQPNNSHASTIYRWLLKYVNTISKFTDQQTITAGEELQADEVEYKRRANHKTHGVKEEYFIDVIDSKTRYIVSSYYNPDRETEVLTNVYKVAKNRVGDQVKVISTDGLVGYPRVIKKVFGLNPHATKNPKIIHNIIKSDSGKFNYKIERFHNTLRERTKIMRGFHGSIDSARLILKGFEVNYNYIRGHLALEKKTPQELAIPTLTLGNKNKWLQLIELGYKTPKRPMDNNPYRVITLNDFM
jgi:transposase-like protein